MADILNIATMVATIAVIGAAVLRKISTRAMYAAFMPIEAARFTIGLLAGRWSQVAFSGVFLAVLIVVWLRQTRTEGRQS